MLISLNRIVNTVPFPTSDSKVIVPPKDITEFFTMANPKPVPVLLVVKLGVNSLCLSSSGIPTPLSLIEISMRSFFLCANK